MHIPYSLIYSTHNGDDAPQNMIYTLNSYETSTQMSKFWYDC